LLRAPQTPDEQYDKDLVTFWNTMSDWAVKINTTVILSQAFDKQEIDRGTVPDSGT